jgi:hypothetical protein
MKTLCGAALLCLAAAFMGGCASRHAGPVYHAGDENPPDFLVGPVATVLTNLNGFSAHVTATTSSPEGAAQAQSGDLLGREGRLIFQPALAIKGKRARAEGGLFFLWDETKHSGYVLSEALQGYAPIKSDTEAGSQLNITKDGIREDVNGHPCHRCEAVVLLDNGLTARLTLWQADDARHFPVRIEAVNGLNHMTLDFSEIHLEYPDQKLFLLPDGFTAYASPVALMNELIVRDSSLAKKYQTGEFDEPTDVRSSNWHQTNPDLR